MASLALTAFGKACHTYMDSVSPAHHGWQEYKMPKRNVKVTDPETGIVVGEAEGWDIVKFARDGWAHKKTEGGQPTTEQREQAVLYMRGAFLTTFQNRWFCMAVKSESERRKVYGFVESLGLSWDHDLIPIDDMDSPLPKRTPGVNFRNSGIIYT